MTAADYLRWEVVGNRVGRYRRINDADLDWAIATMHKPSAHPALVHTMIMGLFMTAQSVTPAQRTKIQEAVTPLLSSADVNDRKWAKATLKRVAG